MRHCRTRPDGRHRPNGSFFASLRVPYAFVKRGQNKPRPACPSGDSGSSACGQPSTVASGGLDLRRPRRAARRGGSGRSAACGKTAHERAEPARTRAPDWPCRRGRPRRRDLRLGIVRREPRCRGELALGRDGRPSRCSATPVQDLRVRATVRGRPGERSELPRRRQAPRSPAAPRTLGTNGGRPRRVLRVQQVVRARTADDVSGWTPLRRLPGRQRPACVWPAQ